ncbi:Oidioi.mRNA.OKI2018_I69.XSR.g14567.t3.cds [Oikopleura dioica]|uniref:Oidioi.mRNA.OKI2018_I69.XSR.g14567.t3.cds n=1 Tax=Oikopleura dioica TaxID=34765 RepID=A0ABN7SGH9_OIKDI|nr:Oidioi.mRNA.OKI2018_I69.XSR.g14567.t3.cds [Oikopleura dioica]
MNPEVPPIRPEERFISNQQQQLLQAANAQHMAAMVALEAMQNHAKAAAQSKAVQQLVQGRAGSPVKRERENDECESPLPKTLRLLPPPTSSAIPGLPGFNPANLPGFAAAAAAQSAASNPSTSSPPASAALETPKFPLNSPLAALAQRNAEANAAAAVASTQITTSSDTAKPTPTAMPSTSSSNPLSAVTAAALGRLFPGLSANMDAKLDVAEGDPDDDENPGSINMSICVNGVVYEGTLFAKMEETYLEAKKSHTPEQSEKVQSPVAADAADEQITTVMPKSPQ